MSIKIALAGNPNCGKTTLFNELTGSSQYVGNWPGVTVEKKDGLLKGHKDVIIQDLPGIYSLSPYTLEEKVARNYLVNDRPDVILNIIDGTNLERNLYLTTQLAELGIPMVLAVNMMDLVKKSGDHINFQKLSELLHCEVVEISALHGTNCRKAAELAIAQAGRTVDEHAHVFTGSVEHALAHIEESVYNMVKPELLRWYAIKIFERDEEMASQVHLSQQLHDHLEAHIKDCEKEMDDDAESIIINQRYEYITRIIDQILTRGKQLHSMTLSDKIDSVVTNRVLALPIFFIIMTLVYYISVTTVGGWATDWTNDVFFGEIVNDAATSFLASIQAPDWLSGLIVDGIIGGVGTVLGFVPQILLIFFFMSLLEDSGYMARVAFIMDRIFRRFGLSGKSFIPILVGMGCGVPAVMATRTIENERDRRMTIMLCTFIPCSAKAVIISMITSTFFPDSIFLAPAMYFLGIAVIVLSGIALKKTHLFSGDPAPFVMELPAYHIPSAKTVLMHTWERLWGFIKKAGTILFLACIVMWVLSTFGFENGGFGAVEDVSNSLMALLGGAIAWIFAPLGFGSWQPVAASISGFSAKEAIVTTMGVLANVDESMVEETAVVGAAIQSWFPNVAAAFSFLVFNLLDSPCLAAIATMAQQMQSRKWFWFAVLYQNVFAYGVSLCVYQLGSVILGVPVGLGTAAAALILLFLLYMLFRRDPYKNMKKAVRRSAAA